jgi:ketosteroid isomerase-like protein
MDPRDREAIVRRSIEAWNSDDWEERLREIWDPEGVIVAPEGWPEAGTFVGWEEMVGQWRRIKESWTQDQVQLTSAEQAGEGLLGGVRWTLQGEASGAPLEVQAWILCEFRGDRLAKMAYFLDEDAARRAAEALGA